MTHVEKTNSKYIFYVTYFESLDLNSWLYIPKVTLWATVFGLFVYLTLGMFAVSIKTITTWAPVVQQNRMEIHLDSDFGFSSFADFIPSVLYLYCTKGKGVWREDSVQKDYITKSEKKL